MYATNVKEIEKKESNFTPVKYLEYKNVVKKGLKESDGNDLNDYGFTYWDSEKKEEVLVDLSDGAIVIGEGIAITGQHKTSFSMVNGKKVPSLFNSNIISSFNDFLEISLLTKKQDGSMGRTVLYSGQYKGIDILGSNGLSFFDNNIKVFDGRKTKMVFIAKVKENNTYDLYCLKLSGVRYNTWINYTNLVGGSLGLFDKKVLFKTNTKIDTPKQKNVYVPLFEIGGELSEKEKEVQVILSNERIEYDKLTQERLKGNNDSLKDESNNILNNSNDDIKVEDFIS